MGLLCHLHVTTQRVLYLYGQNFTVLKGAGLLTGRAEEWRTDI